MVRGYKTSGYDDPDAVPLFPGEPISRAVSPAKHNKMVSNWLAQLWLAARQDTVRSTCLAFTVVRACFIC